MNSLFRGWWPVAAALLLPPGTAQAETEAEREFFEKRIRPVLVEHCYECHGEGKVAEGGLRLDRAEAMRKGGDSGPALVAGEPGQSRLLAALEYLGELKMPPAGRLPDSVVRDFAKWIQSGAFDPRTGEVVSEQPFDLARRRDEHWAWHAPRGEVGQSIDALLAKRLAADGIEPSPLADRRVLLRRLHFDLIGLPPSLQRLEQFEVAWSRDPKRAYRDEVEWLLGNPHFGEHWARHWLDVVRYSETKGHVTDQERPYAWKYRDYVIDCFNDDLPYDLFVREHLAGDAMDRRRPGEETNAPPAATGVWFMHEMHFMAVDPLQQRWDEINAQLDILGRAFIGITIECARCHDHKFDALSQEDYYALAGFFYSTELKPQRVGPRHELNSQQAARIEPLEENYREFLEKRRKGRLKAQTPKAGGGYFPVSDELGVQSPNDTRQLFQKMSALEKADPSWGFWVRAAGDVSGTNVPLLIRGNHRRPGPAVAQRFLSALGGAALPADASSTGSGREWLAEQLVHPENPLLSRVWVNRLWHHLFGRGLVATPNNFGVLGERPSHPQLLDYLSLRLVDQDWSTKSLIREIVFSEAYRRSSVSRPELRELDPENRLLARQNRRRLTAEQLRDTLLQTAGVLSSQMHGTSVDCFVPPYATANKPGNVPKSGPLLGDYRRSVYLKVRRSFYDPFLVAFDFPDRSKSVGRRDVTRVPAQALAMLNSPLVHKVMEHWGARMQSLEADDRTRLQRMWLESVGRPANEEELSVMLVLRQQLMEAGPAEPGQVWQDLGHVIVNLPDFLSLP